MHTQGRRIALMLLNGCLVVAMAMSSSCAIAEDTATHLQRVIVVNSLDRTGKTPFHIKIAFQVFNLEGKPFDTGFLEEWWASSGESLLTLTSSAMKIADPVVFDDSVNLDPRERYLLHKLLESELHPVPDLPNGAANELQEAPKAFDKLTLTCIIFPSKTPIAARSLPLSFCVDQQTDAVRAQYEAESGSMMHNALGNFHGTYVPVDLEISFLKRTAITGKVVGLEVFDPSKLSVKFSAIAALTDAQGEGCTPGKGLKKALPVYPFSAKTSHIGGSVVLLGVISKQGTVNNITAIASSSNLLTQSAVDAFKQWTYEPCLLNGQPRELETTIMSFHFRESFTVGAPLQMTSH